MEHLLNSIKETIRRYEETGNIEYLDSARVMIRIIRRNKNENH